MTRKVVDRVNVERILCKEEPASAGATIITFTYTLTLSNNNLCSLTHPKKTTFLCAQLTNDELTLRALSLYKARLRQLCLFRVSKTGSWSSDLPQKATSISLEAQALESSNIVGVVPSTAQVPRVPLWRNALSLRCHPCTKRGF